MITKLYGGNVLLDFSSSGHRYKVSLDGGKTWEKKQGVTSILSKVVVKDGLIPWAASLAATTFLEALQTHFEGGGSYATFDSVVALKLAKAAHSVKKEAGADVGKVVHDWIADYLATGQELILLPEGEAAKNGVGAFLRWAKDQQIEFVASERPVYSIEHEYCGTYDVKFKLGGKTYLGDFKTSDPKREYDAKTKTFTGGVRAYPEHYIQVGGYDLANNEESGEVMDGHMVIYITKSGKLYTFLNPDVVGAQEAFVAALTLARALDRFNK